MSEFDCIFVGLCKSEEGVGFAVVRSLSSSFFFYSFFFVFWGVGLVNCSLCPDKILAICQGTNLIEDIQMMYWGFHQVGPTVSVGTINHDHLVICLWEFLFGEVCRFSGK